VVVKGRSQHQPDLLLAGILIGVVGFVVGCGPDPIEAGPATELRVHRGDLVQRILLTGDLEAIESAEVKVPRTREHRLQIQRLATDGAMVTEGETVLEFDNSSFTANLDQQRTAVQRSQRTLLQTRALGDARMREADAAVERARIALAKAELDASVPVSIRSRYDHSRFQLALTKARADHDKALADHRATSASVDADIEVDEEEYRKARRELTVAEEALDALVLTAPRDGIVVVEENPWEDRKFQVGDTVFPGWTVIGIPDLDKLRARASLSDVDDGSLEVGTPVVCTPDIEPGLHLEGLVAEITAIAREQRIFSERRGFDVTIELTGAADDVLLVPGMSVRVEAERRTPDQLLIPRGAVDFTTEPPTALRRNGSRIDIELGLCSAQECVLAGGLEEGDLLASTGGGAS
jgi:multidrug efflux pump subunit AcrA (membrane-fusion protein)